MATKSKKKVGCLFNKKYTIHPYTNIHTDKKYKFGKLFVNLMILSSDFITFPELCPG